MEVAHPLRKHLTRACRASAHRSYRPHLSPPMINTVFRIMYIMFASRWGASGSSASRPLNLPVLDVDPHQPGNQPLRPGHQRPAHHLALALPAPTLLTHRFRQRPVKAPAIIQPDGSQRPAAQNDRHDAGNLDALFHLSLQRHSSPGTSQRHHQGRNTSEERDPRVASSWATQPKDRDASR